MLIFFHVGGEITVHTQPMHFTTDNDLIFTYDWNVVFRLAGNGAGITSVALIEVYGHSPLLNFIFF